MKLIDKIKDLFMDEVDIDDELEIEEETEIEEPKKEKPVKKEEHVLPKVMRETIEEEDKLDLKTRFKEEKTVPVEPPKTKSFNFPIDFELDVPSRNSNSSNNLTHSTDNIIKHEPKVEKKEEVVVEKQAPTPPSHNINVLDFEKEAAKKVSSLYSNGKELITEKPRFKATPVISPVYGILDKNYTKEEVRERDEASSTMKRPSKKVDFETVRKKAFGNLADEIKDNLLCENCELYKEVKKISALKEDDLLYDMTVDEEEPVTIEKAYDNYEEFGVAYEPKKTRQPVEKEPEDIKEEVEEIETEVNESIAKLETRLDDIISKTHQIEDAVINDHNEEDEVEVLDKPDIVYNDKIDEEETPIEEKPLPSRSAPKSTPKSDTKVDDDFFELIDSMYKERSDE